MSKGDEAKAFFMSGCNCSQAVAAAFSEEMDMPVEQVKRLTSGFGAGMGRMREVCGAVSATVFVISALYDEDKASVYSRVQSVASELKEQNGSIICRELLGLQIKGADSPTPQPRTQEYYKKRPCPELVKQAADVLEQYIAANPYKK